MIDHISTEASANPGDMAYVEVICQGSDAGLATIYLPLSTVGTYGAYEAMVGGGAVTCYAGNSLIIRAFRDSDVPAPGSGLRSAISVSVVGHLVNRPPQ